MRMPTWIKSLNKWLWNRTPSHLVQKGLTLHKYLVTVYYFPPHIFTKFNFLAARFELSPGTKDAGGQAGGGGTIWTGGAGIHQGDDHAERGKELPLCCNTMK